VKERWPAMGAVMAKDLTAIRRSKGVMLPMVIVPTLLLVVLPAVVGLAARNAHAPDISHVLRSLPGNIAKPILRVPEAERLVTLVDGYLLFASSPEVLRAFTTSPAGALELKIGEVPLLRMSVKDLRQFLKERHDALASYLAAKNDLPREEVSRKLGSLVEALQFVDRLEVSHRSQAGQVNLTLRLSLAYPLK